MNSDHFCFLFKIKVGSFFLFFSYLSMSCAATESESKSYSEDLQIAISSVSNHLPPGQFYIVSDGIEFMRNLSRDDDCEDSFHIVDIEKLVDRVHLWKKHMPSITPFYAMKTNPDPIVVNVLAALGISFDCASPNEISQVLGLGVDPSRIIYANPRKSFRGIQYAQEQGIEMMTFDSIEELDKMLKYAPGGRFVLRIKTDDSHSFTPLSSKFGATKDKAYEILDYGFQHGAEIIGISFHVGGNCDSFISFSKGLDDCQELFEYCERKWKKKLFIVDLGGGWPGVDDDHFVILAKQINAKIDQIFDSSVRVIAEPGRFISTLTTIAAMRIIGKNVIETSAGREFSYYLSNGAYGFFLCSIYYNHDNKLILSEKWDFRPLYGEGTSGIMYPTLLWGPTCDSGDKIIDDVYMPEMESGDFLYVRNVGAYTSALQTSFNQITPSKVYYICEIKLTPE